MPRQITRQIIESSGDSASSRQSTRVIAVSSESDSQEEHSFRDSFPQEQVDLVKSAAADIPEESKENNPSIGRTALQHISTKGLIPPEHRTLADITGEHTQANQSLELEGAILGMEKVQLDSFVDEPPVAPEPEVVPLERLVISRLVLTNFKSYAGRQEIGPFHSSFSAIVGPNGSGKSNVIDSLLFVFGFRASKMRHGKLSALIHNSSSHPDLTSCSVEVHFQNIIDRDDTSVPVPDTELIVSRKAFRNNSSKYYINKRESSFQEVTTLLKDRGIDLDHKRFLILQGEVESIAQMKPKAENDNEDGLLEYLEDIIGTSSYKKSIEEADTKVDVLNEECTEKSGRLKIVEKEIDSLEEQRSSVLQFLETENQISLAQSSFYQLNLHTSLKKSELSQKVIEENTVKLEAEIQKASSDTQEIDNIKNQVKEKDQELVKLKSTVQKLSKDVSKGEIEKVQLEEKKKHVDTKRKKLEKSIESAKFAKNSAETWLTNYEQETSGQNNQLQTYENDMQEELQKFERIQEDLKDKTQQFTDKIEHIQQQLGPWREKITQKESELAVATSEADIIKEKNDQANQTLKEAREKAEDIIKQGRAKESDLGQLKKELHHVTNQISLGTDECGDASQKLAKMKMKLTSLRQNVDNAKQSLVDSMSQNKVLVSLTKLSNSGRIEGFHGRLGGLGTIDEQYDVAISTACPSLENFVVDTVEGGQACVNYLRKNNLGRAKFILMDQLPKKRMDRIDTPENVPRLFDLVKPAHPKFSPAFYSVLGDTLVARDVEQARRIAYGKRRFRVVTIDGVVVDTSGTMSGGGNVLRGGMKSELSSAVSESELEKMEAEKNEYEATFKIAEDTLHMMETSLKELKEKKPKLELDISKVKMDIENLAGEMGEAQAQFKEIQREVKSSRPDTGALEAAEQKVSEKEAELEELKEHSRSLEDEITDLQEKILEAGGIELRMQRAKIDGLKEQIELLNTRLSNGLMEKTKNQNEVRKQDRIIENAEKEIEVGENDIAEITELLSKKLAFLENIQSEVDKATDVFEECQEELDTLRKSLKEKEKEIESLRSTEIELRNTIEEHEKLVKEEHLVQKHWQDLLKELVLHDLVNLGGHSKKKSPVVKSESDEMEIDDDAKQDNEDDEMPVHFIEHSNEELDGLNGDKLKNQIDNLKEKIKDVRVDMQVLKDYQRRMGEFQERKSILNDAVSARDKLKKVVDDLRQKRLDEFMTGFSAISSKLKEMYQMITMGGNAELELVDSLDPFAEGILFSVMPPKKNWKNISNLSGGEKTLSSLALVFALHHYKPTPLYVMDEIDAALDFRNVSIVATYIKERTKNGQFIVISLRNNMFELAQQLVGIYKVNNMTKSIALQNKDYLRRS